MKLNLIVLIALFSKLSICSYSDPLLLNQESDDDEINEMDYYENSGEVSLQKVHIPVKGPVPESDQYYDKYGRKIVYEVDMDEVDAMVEQYLLMGKDKFNAYLAKGGSGHFLDFISKLKDKLKKHKEEEDDDCGSEQDPEIPNPYEVPPDLDDDKVCEFVKFKKLLLDTSKEWDEKDIDKMIASLASFDFTEDPYCETGENEEDCINLKAIKVKSEDQKGWLEENAKRRLELLNEVMDSPYDIDDETIVDSEEFQYRKHNIFLDQDDNEFANIGTSFASSYTLLLTAISSVLSLI